MPILRLSSAVVVLVGITRIRSTSAAPFSEKNIDYNTNNNPDAKDAREYRWIEPDPQRAYFPSPDDWTKFPVYQVIVDRFFDGDPLNNVQHDGFLFDWQSNSGPLTGFDVRDMVSRQGGDWKGITQKLDYIRGMGCRAMWISPVQQNRDGSPMGYLQMDKTLLERRFGNLADFRTFVDEAHKRGMYIVVDIVNNHLAEMLDWVSETGDDDDDKIMPFRMHHGGKLSDPTHDNRTGEPKIRPKQKVLKACKRTPGCDPNGFQPYVDYHFDNTWFETGKYPGMTYREAGFAGMPLGIEDLNGTGGYWNSAFHHSGEMPVSEEGPWNWPLGKLYGTLDDLRTTNSSIVDKLIAASVGIIHALDIDGFRLDTPRECAQTSWTRWRTAIDSAARAVGKTNFGTWGELWSSPERAATYMGRGKDIPMYFYEGQEEQKKFIDPEHPIFDGLINYNYFYWIVTVFRKGISNQAYMAFNILEWETRLGYDIEWPSFPVKGTERRPVYQMWNFCGSHDQHRMPQFYEGYERLRLCQAWLFTWPGIPVTYQGDEQGLLTPGSGLAYWGREFMASSVGWATVPTVKAPDGTLGNPANSDNFDQGSRLYRFYRRLTGLREIWWDSAFRCLGDGVDGGGLPERIECVSAQDGSPLPAVFGYRRLCSPGQWGVVMLMNLESAPLDARCDSLFAAHPDVSVFNAMRQANGYDSPFAYEPVPDTSVLHFEPFEVKALVDEARAFNLNVDTVSPKHDTAMSVDEWRSQRVLVTFTEPVDPTSLLLEIDGARLIPTSWEEKGARLVLQLGADWEIYGEGVHTIRVVKATSLDGARSLVVPYSFRVRVGPPSNPIVTRPMRVDHDIIIIEDSGEVYLEHRAIGATYFRAQNAGDQGRWDRASAWQLVQGTRFLWKDYQPGVPVVIQYYVDGSAAYMVTACRVSSTEVCPASYYGKGSGKDLMAFKGAMNQWLELPAWSFQPPSAASGDHNWTIDIHVSIQDSAYLIDVMGDMEYMLGTGNDVTNPFFFPYQTFCFRGFRNSAPKGKGFAGCDDRLPHPLSELDTDLCSCDMTPMTLLLYDSGMNHTEKWMMEHFPEYWRRVDAQGNLVRHGLTQYVPDPSSGLYNLRIPANVCPLYSNCRIIFNDLDLTYVIGPSPPGVVALGSGSLEIAEMLCLVWLLVPFAAALWSSLRKKRYSVVTVVAPATAAAPSSARAPRSLFARARSSMLSKSSSSSFLVPGDLLKPQQVLVASLEYIIPIEGGVEKAVAGGLGKVAGLLGQYHPGSFVSVHACMPNRTYSFASRDEPIQVTVSGKDLKVNVFRYEVEGELREVDNSPISAPSVTYILLDHPVFRSRQEIYPAPQTSTKTLEFYSLWNQAVARIIDRVKPDVFHCPDFHAAMSILYVERPLPVVVVLHNAEYQGAVSTQHMGKKEAKQFAHIFNLPVPVITRAAFEEGKFTMLKPIVDYTRTHQQGFGVCAVSRNYAAEACQKHAVFWGLPEVCGVENCMPESERMATSQEDGEDPAARRQRAKLFIQEKYNLEQNPNARLFVFVGRWVKQKGVDYIADVAEWMLSTYTDAQLLMVGPVGDSYGTYAKNKMAKLKESGRFAKNLFVYPDFLAVPPELKLACDFCLMPSRDEPFGYVDIEFAWFGAIVVGSLRGGLGKLPGFYFQILNSDSSTHMQKQLKKAISKAMACDEASLSRMSTLARSSSFPVAVWQHEVLQMYDKATRCFDWESQPAVPKPVTMRRTTSSLAPAPEEEVMRFGDTAASLGIHDGVLLPPTPGSVALSTGRLQLMSHRSTQSSRSSTAVSILDIELEGNSQAGAHRKDEEFLRQELSDAEIQVLVEESFNKKQAPLSASDLLEMVEWDMQIKLEKWFFSKLLGTRVFDVPVLDWIIAVCYLSGPLVEALPISHFKDTTGLAFFILDPVCQAASLLCWTWLAQVVPPNLLMAAACLMRLVVLALPFFTGSAIVASIVVGLIAPSDYIFIYYSFMGNSVGDVARLAVRTGGIMAAREIWVWLFLGVRLQTSLTRYLAMSASALLFSVLPAIALLYAPRLYWEFRVPAFHVSWIRKLHVLVLLGLASVIQSLSHVSDTALLVLRQTSPFELKYRPSYCMALGAAGLAPILVFALLMHRLPSYAMSMVKGFACFSMPAVVLRCWAMYEVNQANEFSMNLDVVIFVSSALGSLGGYAVAVAVLATVGSRWRFVSYTCYTGVLSNLARMASFVIVQQRTGQDDPLNVTWLPQTLAWELLIVALPPCSLAVVLRIVAFIFFDAEATSMLRTAQQRRLVRHSRSGKGLKDLQHASASGEADSSAVVNIERSPAERRITGLGERGQLNLPGGLDARSEASCPSPSSESSCSGSVDADRIGIPPLVGEFGRKSQI